MAVAALRYVIYFPFMNDVILAHNCQELVN